MLVAIVKMLGAVDKRDSARLRRNTTKIVTVLAVIFTLFTGIGFSDIAKI